MNYGRLERKWLWINLRYCTRIFLEGLRKNVKTSVSISLTFQIWSRSATHWTAIYSGASVWPTFQVRLSTMLLLRIVRNCNVLRSNEWPSKFYESWLIYLSVESEEHTQNIVECTISPHIMGKSRPKVWEAYLRFLYWIRHPNFCLCQNCLVLISLNCL